MKHLLVIIISLVSAIVIFCLGYLTGCNQKPPISQIVSSEQPSSPLSGELVAYDRLNGPESSQYKKFIVLSEEKKTVQDGQEVPDITERAYIVDNYPNPKKYKAIATAHLPGITGLSYSLGKVGDKYNLLDVVFDTMIFTSDGEIITESIAETNKLNPTLLVSYDKDKRLTNPFNVRLGTEGVGDVAIAKVDAATGKIVPGSYKQTYDPTQ